MQLTIRPAKREEAVWLSSRLRFEDRREAEVIHQGKIDLVRSMRHSDDTFTVRFSPQGDPVALFGVGHDPQDKFMGVPWFMATAEVHKGALALWREAPHWIDMWQERYPHGLHNLVDSRNLLHIRWIAKAGFTLGNTAIIHGFPFIYFSRSSK